MDMLSGQQLVNKQKQGVHAEVALQNKDIICYYFSAHWWYVLIWCVLEFQTFKDIFIFQPSLPHVYPNPSRLLQGKIWKFPSPYWTDILTLHFPFKLGFGSCRCSPWMYIRFLWPKRKRDDTVHGRITCWLARNSMGNTACWVKF